MTNRLTIPQLRKANVARCIDSFHPIESWSPFDWAVAAAGEAGEALNALKKLRRGDGDAKAVVHELADFVIYTDLLYARIGVPADALAWPKHFPAGPRRFDQAIVKLSWASNHLLDVCEKFSTNASSQAWTWETRGWPLRWSRVCKPAFTIAASIGSDLTDAIVEKFDIVSDRVGSAVKLGAKEAA